MNRVSPNIRIALATLALLVGCNAADQNAPPASASEQVAPVVSSIDSVDPIREWFNASVDRPRFITILSPT